MAKRSKKSRAPLAGRSVAGSPAGAFGMEDTAEAHALFGDLADDVAHAEASYRAGVASGERDLGVAWIRRHAGRLGRKPEAQGYLLCKRGLVQCLVATGRLTEALALCEDLARLDAADTTTARFVHLDILMTLRRFDAARAICAARADEPYSGWDYARALIEFADAGDGEESRRLLATAIDANPHVPRLMLSGEQIDRDLTLVTIGAEDEAALYVRDSRGVWLDVPGAISWLRAVTGTAVDPTAKPARAPRGAMLDALAVLPQDEAEEWQMHLGRDPGAGWSFHVVSALDGRMITVDASARKPRAEELWGTLSTAMRFPREGEPRRPARVAMRPGAFPTAWAKRFQRIGIRQEFRDTLTELDRALADVDERIAAAERARAEEEDDTFDPAAVAAALAALPQEPGEIWEADLRHAPAWVTGEGEPYRPWIALVASRTHDHVLVPDITTTRPDDGHLVRLVLRTMREAGIRPEQLEVADADVAAGLAAALAPAGIPVSLAAALPVIEKMAESLATAMDGPDTLRPLAGVPGMTDALQRGLYAAAAEFYRARPWRKLPSDMPLDIHRPDGRLVHAVVMGQSGVQQGLAIYEDATTLAAALRGDEKAAAKSTSLAVMFGEAFEISARDHDAINRHGFDIAGPEAWPLVIRIEPGFATRPPLVWEVELITACLQEVVTRVSNNTR